MKINSIGLLGHGAFGAFLEEVINRFSPQVKIKIHSSHVAEDNTRFFEEADVCKCDVLVICCAIRDFEATLRRLLPFIPTTTIIMDVATVKSHTTKLLKELAGDRPHISSHPMFGPEGYKKTNGDMTGYRLVITDSTIPVPDLDRLKVFLNSLGLIILEMTADEHDRYLAESLFLTHYIGQTIKHAGFKRTPIDSVSFGYLMDAVESVQNDERLFHDVYRFNPYCQAVADNFNQSQDSVYKNLPTD